MTEQELTILTVLAAAVLGALIGLAIAKIAQWFKL